MTNKIKHNRVAKFKKERIYGTKSNIKITISYWKLTKGMKG